MIFFRCLGAILLLFGFTCCLVLVWDQNHARLLANGGYALAWALALLVCAVAIGVLMLRKSAALLVGLGLLLMSVFLMTGAIVHFLVGSTVSIILAIPFLAVVGGIALCWRQLKTW